MCANIFSRLFKRRRQRQPSKETVGELGEQKAAEYLTNLGYNIRSRNWRSRIGEIDIVAEQDHTLVFVEVKSSVRRTSISPELRVNYAKQEKLRRLAKSYLQSYRGHSAVRFDVIAVWWEGPNSHIEHFINAFS